MVGISALNKVIDSNPTVMRAPVQQDHSKLSAAVAPSALTVEASADAPLFRIASFRCDAVADAVAGSNFASFCGDQRESKGTGVKFFHSPAKAHI